MGSNKRRDKKYNKELGRIIKQWKRETRNKKVKQKDTNTRTSSKENQRFPVCKRT